MSSLAFLRGSKVVNVSIPEVFMLHSDWHMMRDRDLEKFTLLEVSSLRQYRNKSLGSRSFKTRAYLAGGVYLHIGQRSLRKHK